MHFFIRQKLNKESSELTLWISVEWKCIKFFMINLFKYFPFRVHTSLLANEKESTKNSLLSSPQL